MEFYVQKIKFKVVTVMKTKAKNNRIAIKLYALGIGIEIELFFRLKSDIEQLKLKIFSTMTLIACQSNVDRSHNKSSRPDFASECVCRRAC